MRVTKVARLHDEQRTLDTRKQKLTAKAFASGDISVHCSECDGRGRRELRHEERETVEALTFQFWQLTSDIAAKLPSVKRTALINRLSNLERLGVIESKHAGPRGEKMWRLQP